MDGTGPTDPAETQEVLADRFRLLERIGTGGMGVVYAATDTLLDRKVALKRVAPERMSDASSRRRLLREARRAGALQDPRIASIFDVFEHDGEFVIVMEYVDGTTLRDRMATPPALAEFLPVAMQCVDALAVAHREGVIHRDIKPENVMITRAGQVKILDFGIARRMTTSGDATATLETAAGDALLGTPAYMAPETIRGHEPSARADIFSLGVVFYEWLAGAHPFRGETIGTTLANVLHVDAEPLGRLRPDLPAELAELVGDMLAKDVQDRPEHAQDVAPRLESAAAIGERGGSRPRSPRRGPRRKGAVVVSVTLVLIAAVWLARLRSPRLGASGGTLPEHAHVAVLPIRTTDVDADGEAFAMGLTDALTTVLARRTSSNVLQVADLSDVLDDHVDGIESGHEVLGVNLILETDLAVDEREYVGSVTLEAAGTDEPHRRAAFRVPISSPAGLLDAIVAASDGVLGLSAAGRGVETFGVSDWGAGTLRFYLRGLGRLHQPDATAWRAALEEFDLAMRTDPSLASPHAAAARAYFKLYGAEPAESLLDRALEACDRAISLDSTRAAAFRTAAFVYETRGDRARATASLTRAAALDPTDDDAVHELARLHGRAGDAAGEEATYLRAISDRPHYWRPYWWLGSFLYRQGRFTDARAAFASMAECAPDYYLSFSNLGAIDVLEGHYRDATAALARSIALHPTETAFSNLATAHFALRDFDAAIDTYQTAIQTGFAEYEFWLNLGDAYFWHPDKRSLAREAYEQAVRLGRDELTRRPYHLDVLSNLAVLYPKVGLPDSARACISRALVRGAENPSVQFGAALTFWQLGERRVALDWIERAVGGGYPASWLRDSVVFDDWRGEPRFDALVHGASGEPAGDAPLAGG